MKQFNYNIISHGDSHCFVLSITNKFGKVIFEHSVTQVNSDWIYLYGSSGEFLKIISCPNKIGRCYLNYHNNDKSLLFNIYFENGVFTITVKNNNESANITFTQCVLIFSASDYNMEKVRSLINDLSIY